MIRYQSASSSTRTDKSVNNRRCLIVSAALDSTAFVFGGDERRKIPADYGMNSGLGARKSIAKSEIAQSYFNNKAIWHMPENSVANFQIFAGHLQPESISIDEVKSATDIVYSWEHGGHGRLASFYVVFFVEQSFRSRAYAQVNRLLAEVDISLLTEWSMIALLRSSFTARSFLPAWPRLLSSVHERLEQQGKNPSRLLRGLNR